MKTFFSLLRYKRFWILNLVIPLLVSFLLMTIIGLSISQQMNSVPSKTQMGVVYSGDTTDFIEGLKKQNDIELIFDIDSSSIYEKVSSRKFSLGMIIPENFSTNIQEHQKNELKVYYNNEKDLKKLQTYLEAYKNKIISVRLDSIQLSKNFLSPFSVKEVNALDLNEFLNQGIKMIESTLKTLLPLILILFGFLGLIIPASIIFSNAKNKGKIEDASFLDKIIGVSIWGTLISLLIVIGLKSSLFLIPRQPAFLQGIFKSYLSNYNLLQFTILLFLSHLFWSNILAFFNRKAQTFLGAFGFSYFMFSIFFILTFLTSSIISILNYEENWIVTFMPVFNILSGGQQVLSEKGISLFFFILLIIGLFMWAVIGFAMNRSSNK